MLFLSGTKKPPGLRPRRSVSRSLSLETTRLGRWSFPAQGRSRGNPRRHTDPRAGGCSRPRTCPHERLCAARTIAAIWRFLRASRPSVLLQVDKARAAFRRTPEPTARCRGVKLLDTRVRRLLVTHKAGFAPATYILEECRSTDELLMLVGQTLQRVYRGGGRNRTFAMLVRSFQSIGSLRNRVTELEPSWHPCARPQNARLISQTPNRGSIILSSEEYTQRRRLSTSANKKMYENFFRCINTRAMPALKSPDACFFLPIQVPEYSVRQNPRIPEYSESSAGMLIGRPGQLLASPFVLVRQRYAERTLGTCQFRLNRFVHEYRRDAF